MSELPLGWKRSNLEVLASASGGSTPSKAEPRFWNGGNVPWVSPKDMKTFVISDSEDHITEGALERLTLVPEDSVLVVVRSGILSRTLPVAITTAPVTINQDMRAFIPAQGVSATFLAWQLIANEYEILDACSKDGTTVASIEGVALAQFPIWIAPRAEQTRIVEKLEDLLGSLDAAVAELKAAQRKLARYRQSLLKAAVEGALTAQWRAARTSSLSLPRRRESSFSGVPAEQELDAQTQGLRKDARLRGAFNGRMSDHDGKSETGPQLLQRILQERRARWEDKQRAKFEQTGKTPAKGWQAKYPEPVAPDTTDLLALPEGWVWASLDALVADSSYGTSAKCGYGNSGTPVLRIPNVSGGDLDLRDMKFSDGPLPLTAEDFLDIGDVLVIRTNGSIGLVGRAAAVTAPLPAPHYFASYLLRLRCVNRTVLHHWVSTFLASPVGRRWIEERAASSAGQHNISLSALLTMPVPLPAQVEQTQILAILDAQLSAAKEQDAALTRALRQAAAQRRNLLKAAFAGQLVPQDPTDEPASELLARIRASKADNAGRTRAARNAK